MSAWIRAGDPFGDEEGPTRSGTLLERLFAMSAPCLRRVPGRETLRWGTFVVKRYRGDLWRDFWQERLRGAVRSPARRECENLLALAECGVPVPAAVAWAEEPPALGRLGTSGGRSACVMEHVEHAETLRQRCERSGADTRLLRELARLVARLHASGWCHRDLYLEHFLIREDAPVLIDCGRARHGAPLGRRWIVKDLAALLHSTPERVGERTRLAFFARYLRAWDPDRELGRAERRELARSVLRKARRLAAHAPRHVYDATLALEPRT